jgi:hypothetical protein
MAMSGAPVFDALVRIERLAEIPPSSGERVIA